MAYIGRGLDNGVRNQFVYAATQGQTAFTGADSDGKTLAMTDILYTDCYQNGVKLKPTTDYTVSLTTLTLISAASVNDVINIVAFDIFAVPDTVPASTGGTFNGGIGATTGTFSGAVSGTTGTFSGNVAVTGVQTITANGAHINLDTPSSGQNAWVTWKDNGSAKWEVNKSTTHDFNIYSYAASANVLIFKPDGKILLGTTTVNGNGGLTVVPNADGDTANLVWNKTAGSSTGALILNHSGSYKGGISYSSSGTSFNTSSDYRVKENVDYTWDATTRLKQLKPARFNFISDDTNTLVDGFLAHEVSSIVPEAITGTKDAMTAQVLYVEDDVLPEGKSIGDVKEASVPDYQGIDQSKLVPLLVKALQEQQVVIESLTTRITALEAE